LAALLQRPNVGVGSEEDKDRQMIDELRASHPGLDRSHSTPELISGGEATNRWIHAVFLRGLQLIMASQGHQVLLLGGLEAPFLAVHKNLEPLAVRTIPPDVEVLFAPDVSQAEREALSRSFEDGASASLSIANEVAKGAPFPGDVFAERVWRACRNLNPAMPPQRVWSAEDEKCVDEYVALFHGRPILQQLEMALALSERVLTGKDRPRDRQIQAAAASQMWHELGDIDWARIDRLSATRGGWLRVASLGIQEDSERRAFIGLVRGAMARICEDAPVDVEVSSGAAVRVYRFHAGQRTLIDRRGGRRGRVH